MPFDPLIRHLLAGKILKHRIIRANKCPLFLLLAPFISDEHGIDEPVIEVGLRCQVSLSECNKQRATLSKHKTSVRDYPCLKAGVLFAPHGSSEDTLLADKFPAIAAIYSEEQLFLHTVFTLGQLEDIMLPKAIDYFYQNEEAAVYQMLWRSKHGTAYIQVQRASIFMPSTQQTLHVAKRRKLLPGQDEEFECLTYWISHFLNLWAAHEPIQLQGSIMDWYEEVKEKQKQHITAT
ncbi:unnamed protein product [Miscanthus lutarioriparius]|uniref:Uncharacterized protein n=1 Tax=Miscanthus lutarioriparius TaxID=422564 RepID=A0A811NGV3_9POAL|nr:unnamed protein product [Miscanthus lutarioriparius]